jgi:hypothetical protein
VAAAVQLHVERRAVRLVIGRPPDVDGDLLPVDDGKLRHAETPPTRTLSDPIVTKIENQTQYTHLFWGRSDQGSVERTPNLFLEEAIKAARRGVRVRILLGDAFLDPTYPKDNIYTVQYVNRLAAREGLDLEARLVNSRLRGFDKVHNKGVIADGLRVLVSSINWSNNSPTNNREVGVIIDSPEVAEFFEDLFWSCT